MHSYVSSLRGSLYIAYSRTPAYSISRAALNTLTMQPAVELANTCFVVDPGEVATDMVPWRTSCTECSQNE